MKLSMSVGMAAVVGQLFDVALSKPTIEEALMMRRVRKDLDLVSLPGQVENRLKLYEARGVYETDQASAEWLRSKLKDAFEKQRIASLYSDFALDLLDDLDERLRP